MKTSTTLRALLVLEWIVIVAGVVLSFIMEAYLPPELQAWLAGQADAGITMSDLVLLLVGVPLLIVMLVASIGLFMLRRWGAWLYAVTTFLGTALMPFTGPTVDHALADAVDETALILSGIVIGIAFFSNVLKQKEQPNNEIQATA
jgi:putative Mn2+ efflux pump MntP